MLLDDLKEFEDGVNIIYVGKEFNEQLPEILKFARVTGAVLVSEEWEVRKSLMVNFIKKDGKQIFEINVRNVKENNIKINENIKKSKGFIINDHFLLEESERNLIEEKEKVRAQREELKLQEL